MIKVCLDDGFSLAYCPRFKLTFRSYGSAEVIKSKEKTINAQLFISKVK